MANNNKIEKDAVYIVGLYLNKCPKLDHIINTNDKTPIYDGNIYAYNDDNHKIEKYFATVPLQVKGTTSTKNYYRIARDYIEGYQKDKGCVFFLVQEKIQPSKVLYAILTPAELDQLLQQKTKTIRIDLDVAPADPQKIETEILAFASRRNGEKTDITSPKEIEDLVKGFEKIRGCLDEIEDDGTKYDLESLLDSIKNTKDDSTIGWRDKFIYYSRKALDLAINHLKDHDITELQHDFGLYLYNQKLYHLVEYYYLKSLEECRKRKNIANVATALNNLGELNRVFTRYKEAEPDYQESLKIYRELAKTNRDDYIKYVAMVLNNLAALHFSLNRHHEAEQEYHEALKIRRELAKTNRDAYVGDVAIILNNLAILHNNLTHYDEAEKEYQEALRIYRELAAIDRDAYINYVARTLNNLAILHTNLNRYKKAEREYQEALSIRRELAKTNRDAYIWDVANTLNNIGELHQTISRFDVAEQEYQESLEIRRELVKTNRDAYLKDLAETLYNIASLRKDEKRIDEARVAANEALDIYKELANKYPQIWNEYVVKTQRLLDELNVVKK